MLTVQKCKTTLFVFHTDTVMFNAILLTQVNKRYISSLSIIYSSDIQLQMQVSAVCKVNHIWFSIIKHLSIS